MKMKNLLVYGFVSGSCLDCYCLGHFRSTYVATRGRSSKFTGAPPVGHAEDEKAATAVSPEDKKSWETQESVRRILVLTAVPCRFGTGRRKTSCSTSESMQQGTSRDDVFVLFGIRAFFHPFRQEHKCMETILSRACHQLLATGAITATLASRQRQATECVYSAALISPPSPNVQMSDISNFHQRTHSMQKKKKGSRHLLEYTMYMCSR